MTTPWLILSCALILLSAIMDNARGPLLPHLTEVLELSPQTGSLFFVLASFAAALTGLFFTFLSQRFAIQKFLCLACALGSVTAFLAFVTHSGAALLLLGVMIGISVNIINTLANVCSVAAASPQKRGRAAAIVNMFYGVGAFIGPLWAGLILTHHQPWSLTYWPLGILFALIPFVFFAFLKSRNSSDKSHQIQISNDSRTTPHKITSTQWGFIVIVNLYAVSEILACVWMSTYLVAAYHDTAADAAWINAGFFLVFTLSRLLAGIFLTPQNEKTLLAIALVGGCATLLLGMLAHPFFFVASGMIGLVFPALYGQMTRRWEQQITQLSFALFTIMQIEVGSAHLLIGQLVTSFGITRAYILPVVTMALMTFLYFSIFRPANTKAIAFQSQPE